MLCAQYLCVFVFVDGWSYIIFFFLFILLPPNSGSGSVPVRKDKKMRVKSFKHLCHIEISLCRRFFPLSN